MKINLIFLIYLLVLSCKSQSSPSANWEKGFYGYEYNNPNEVLFIEQEQSIIVLGRNVKTTSENSEQSYGLLKLDISGNTLKEIQSGNKFKSITSMSMYSNKLLLIGHNGTDVRNKKLWIQITDLNFNILQDKIFDDIDVSDYPSPIIKADNQGNFIAILNGNYNLIKLDNELNIIWKKKLVNEFCDTNVSSCISLEDFLFDETNNIVITGNGQPFYKTNEKYLYDLFVIKTDSDGNQIWRKTISHPKIRYYGHSISVYKGDYYVAGREIANKSVFPNHEVDITFAKFSNDGNLIFNKALGGSKAEICSKILSNNDGTFYIVGTTQSNENEYSINNGKNDNLILKVDFNGNVIEIIIFGTTKNEVLYDMVKAKNSNYIIIGDSNDGLKSVLNKEWKVYSKTLK